MEFFSVTALVEEDVIIQMIDARKAPIFIFLTGSKQLHVPVCVWTDIIFICDCTQRTIGTTSNNKLWKY